MTQDYFENPKTDAAFFNILVSHNVSLPLEPSHVDLGVLVDCVGREVLTIDVNHERPDDEVLAIAVYLCLAINDRGGFLAIGANVNAGDAAGKAVAS